MSRSQRKIRIWNELRIASRKRGLTAKINSLKNGYQTYLNRTVFEDGAELSGGEMQKLMLGPRSL